MPKLGMAPIRKSQVIEAVLQLIASQGIKEVTLDRAAKQAGVSKGVVTYYFPNKDQLLLSSCQAFLLGFANNIRQLSEVEWSSLDQLRLIAYVALGKQEDLEFLGTLETFGNTPEDVALSELENEETNALPQAGYSLTLSEYKTVVLQLFGELGIHTGLRGILADVYSEYFQLIEALIQDVLTSSGSIATPKLLTMQFMAMLDGLIIYQVMDFKTASHGEVIEAFLEALNTAGGQ